MLAPVSSSCLLNSLLPFARNRELRTFYHVCLRFKHERLALKHERLPLERANFSHQSNSVFNRETSIFASPAFNILKT